MILNLGSKWLVDGACLIRGEYSFSGNCVEFIVSKFAIREDSRGALDTVKGRWVILEFFVIIEI